MSFQFSQSCFPLAKSSGIILAQATIYSISQNAPVFTTLRVSRLVASAISSLADGIRSFFGNPDGSPRT